MKFDIRGAAAYDAARLNLEFTRVHSPINGRVSKAEVTAGNLVDGSVVLTSVVSNNPIYASFDADEQLVTRALKDLPGGDGARAHLGRIPVRKGTAGSTEVVIQGAEKSRQPASRATISSGVPIRSARRSK